MNINLQENAIVSKIIKNNELTYFALDKGQTISSHISPSLAIALVTEGEIEFEVNHTQIIKQRNEFIELPANIEHALMAIIPSKMLLIQIKDVESLTENNFEN